jgi:antirestriction protein ArdC
MAENRNAQQVREITDKLEQGIKELFESERFKEYLRTMSKFYNYSFNNTLLIAMQKPEATYVAGYTSWQRNFDRQVLKGEKGIKILAPAPYKAQEEREKIDPLTQKPVIGTDGKAVTETVEVLRPAFKVVSVFDVSQTDGKELPDIIVDELKGTVENYEAFFDALKQVSPVPISFEDIPGGAKGFFSPVESRIAIQEGMSEIQTVKTAIHEIAHAKLHAVKPDEKTAPEDRKDRHTKEVEAESVAYTVCQRYGIETSDYSFGYIAGWSSGKETKELKSSLDTIRKTAAEMIEGIDAKLKVLLAEKAQSVEQEAVPEEKLEVPIYRETANYAYEAGEMEAYRASLAANEKCRSAIEAAISSNYGDNSLNAEAAVKSVLEQFSPERVWYVLANTIQQKNFDGRIPQPLKEWAKSVEVCPENASRFLVDKLNPGLTALFVDAFRQQTEPKKEVTSEKTEERDPEVVAWENDEITSIEVKTVEVKSPFAPLPEEAAKAPKAHRLTAEEKEIKVAVMDTLKGQIAYNNDGMRASYRASNHSFNLLARNGVKIEGNTVTQNGEALFKIHRRHAARKTQGCYRELLPTLEYIKQEQKQEKPSIRDQLKAAAKTQPEKKSPVKSKTHDMEL